MNNARHLVVFNNNNNNNNNTNLLLLKSSMRERDIVEYTSTSKTNESCSLSLKTRAPQKKESNWIKTISNMRFVGVIVFAFGSTVDAFLQGRGKNLGYVNTACKGDGGVADMLRIGRERFGFFNDNPNEVRHYHHPCGIPGSFVKKATRPTTSSLSMTATSSGPRTSVQEDEEDDSNNNDSSSSYANIMKDKRGQVNRELAERIWKWEQNLRQENKLPKVEYSVRTGLRLVDEQVKELLSSRKAQSMRSTTTSTSASYSSSTTRPTNNNNNNHDNSNSNSSYDYSQNSMYADLVQEGLSALLDAMRQFRQEKDLDFEAYASHQIRQHLQRILVDQDHSVRPMRLPQSVQDVLKQAKQVAKRLRQEKKKDYDSNDSSHNKNAATATQKNPTVAEVAREMDIPVAKLLDYLHLTRRRTLSMESTVEVYSPSAQDASPSFVDQEDWEISQNMVLDDGRHVHKDQLIDEFLDETQELEGDDQAWIHQEQIAGPLQDLIPDTSEPSPDDSVLADLIRQDMREFLDSTLNQDEVKVVRMVFGLDSGRQVSLKRTAEALNMERDQVSLLLAGSLEKLRASYTSRFVEPYLDDESVVDSV